MNCLNCEKEFKQKRPTAKFCSDNCRVKYHRKHGKKDVIKPFQMQALYNEVRDMLGKIQVAAPKEVYDSPKIKFVDDELPMFTKPQIVLKSFEQWKVAKHECESAEEWEKIKHGIESATNLNRKQKDLLIKYP